MLSVLDDFSPGPQSVPLHLDLSQLLVLPNLLFRLKQFTSWVGNATSSERMLKLLSAILFTPRSLAGGSLPPRIHFELFNKEGHWGVVSTSNKVYVSTTLQTGKGPAFH